MSGITDSLALFSGFSSFFHFYENKKIFFWPITQKIFLISLHLMIWNPDWGIIRSVKALKQAKMSPPDLPIIRILRTEEFPFNFQNS